jgi:hypothetical protein
MGLLREHQIEPANRLTGILQTVNSAIDLSDTGTGKTYVACAVAKRLVLPTLVVAPKIALTAWQRAAEHFDDTLSVINYEALRTGRSPFGHWDNNPPPGFVREEFFVCQCCQCVVDFDNYRPCYCHRAGFHCIITKKKAWKYGKFNFNPAVRFTIFDEVHRCGEVDSLNADMLHAVRRQGLKFLGLSATAATTPMKLNALGAVMGLHNGADFYSWARRQGCRKDEAGHFRWMLGADAQREQMKKIRDCLMVRGVRVSTDDIPGFPERDIVPECYDLEGAGQIDRLYSEMAEPLNELARRSENDSDSPLTQILRARQKIELLKVPVAVELAEDYLAKGFSVVLFVNFKQTLDALRQKLNCPDYIDGSPESVRMRQQTIDRFQVNATRKLIVNNEAGGICVSLQDLDGNYPRMGIVFPNFSAVSMRQVFGRLHRDGGKSKAHYRVLFAAKTVEAKIQRALTAKLNNLDALNDGDLTA